MTERRAGGPEEVDSVEEPVADGPPDENSDEVLEGEIVDESEDGSDDDEPTEVRIGDNVEVSDDEDDDDEAASAAEEAADDADESETDEEEPTDKSTDKPADAESTARSDDNVPAAIRRINELTGDLQRLQAEYVNYKRRVDRDRDLVAQNAVYKVLAPIVDVLDTIDRAREHGEVEGGFKAVADQLEQIVTKLGLTRFGEPGDVFDPTLHEALSHMGTDAEVEETTVKIVAKAGYKIGDRVVRAAQVLVVDPE